MSSLKNFTHVLARLLEMSQPALYERQRALVRAGLLDENEGKGPGSGVRMSPSTVAVLFIAAMAADSLANVDARVREIASGKSREALKLTDARSFQDALAEILASEQLAKRVAKISMSRTSAEAKIAHSPAGKKGPTSVWQFGAAARATPVVHVEVSVDGHIVEKIAREIAEASSDAPRFTVLKNKLG